MRSHCAPSGRLHTNLWSTNPARFCFELRWMVTLWWFVSVFSATTSFHSLWHFTLRAEFNSMSYLSFNFACIAVSCHVVEEKAQPLVMSPGGVTKTPATSPKGEVKRGRGIAGLRCQGRRAFVAGVTRPPDCRVSLACLAGEEGKTRPPCGDHACHVATP